MDNVEYYIRNKLSKHFNIEEYINCISLYDIPWIDKSLYYYESLKFDKDYTYKINSKLYNNTILIHVLNIRSCLNEKIKYFHTGSSLNYILELIDNSKININKGKKNIFCYTTITEEEIRLEKIKMIKK
jgi:hypothetical protein